MSRLVSDAVFAAILIVSMATVWSCRAASSDAPPPEPDLADEVCDRLTRHAPAATTQDDVSAVCREGLEKMRARCTNIEAMMRCAIDVGTNDMVMWCLEGCDSADPAKRPAEEVQIRADLAAIRDAAIEHFETHGTYPLDNASTPHMTNDGRELSDPSRVDWESWAPLGVHHDQPFHGSRMYRSVDEGARFWAVGAYGAFGKHKFCLRGVSENGVPEVAPVFVQLPDVGCGVFP